MAVGRRGFFGALLSAPLAAKAAADKAVADLVGISGASGHLGLGGMGQAPSSGPPAQQSASWSLWDLAKKAIDFPIPEWRVEEMRERAKDLCRIDPDIAALRSFSMSAKITMQRERNLKARLESTRTSHRRYAARQEFEERHGFWFW